MAIICGVCGLTESKYKCPVCELRYCSIACYKPHKANHENETKTEDASKDQAAPQRDRPGTKQRTPKKDFTDFKNDAKFQHLLKRYPSLQIQLQAIYGLTLEPGPDEERTWSKRPLPGISPPQPLSKSRGRGRGRGMRGGRASRGGRGAFESAPVERERGLWTREKGEKEALTVLKKMKSADGESADQSEGLREFVALCRMKYGEGPID